MTSSPERNLLTVLESSYRKNAWHGPTLHAALRGVDARTALRRPGPGRHNIWELAVHAAYWKFAVRRKLSKDRSLQFDFSGSNWFQVSSGRDADWAAARRLLDFEHERFLRFVAPRARDIVRNAAMSRLVFGVAQHDVYHAGQIVLIKKLLAFKS
jgi:uncharacterized damage-inducible protein DinB